MKETIKEILRKVLEIEHVDNNITKNNCDRWDSLAQLNLVVELESKFNITIEPEDIEKIIDLTSIENIIKKLSK